MPRKISEFTFCGIWRFDFVFEAFEGFQLKGSEPSDGKVGLVIDGELNEDPDPKESQINTIEYLIQNSEIIKSTILSSLPEYYEEVKSQYGIDPDNLDPNFPDIKNSDDFSKHLMVSRVHILNTEKKIWHIMVWRSVALGTRNMELDFYCIKTKF